MIVRWRSRQQRAYIAILAMLGFSSIAVLLAPSLTAFLRSLWALSFSWKEIPFTAIGIFIAQILTYRYIIRIDLSTPDTVRRVKLNLSDAPFVFALLVSGPSGVFPLLAASLIASRYLSKYRSEWLDVFFNVTHIGMNYCVFFALVKALTPLHVELFSSVSSLILFLSFLLFIPIWDTYTFSLLHSISAKKPILQVIRGGVTPTAWISVIPIAMGELAALAFINNPWLVIPAVVPLFVAYRALQAVATRLETDAQLKQVNTQLEQTNKELQEAKETLEVRVQERTAELAEANIHLRELHEQEQQARRLVRYFQHELRNYASELSGLVPIIRRMLAPDPAQRLTIDPERLFAVLDLSVTNLNDLMQQLLILTREGTLPPHQQQRIALAPLLDQIRLAALTTTDPLYTATLTDIAIDILADTVIHGDPVYLSIALRTALRNAVEAAHRFHPPHPLQICFRVQCTHHQIILRIEDDGQGFPAALLEQAVLLSDDPNHRFSPGWSSKPGGHGLGLALIDRVATLHEGAMRFGNHVDRAGAWVELRLPVPQDTLVVATALEIDNHTLHSAD